MFGSRQTGVNAYAKIGMETGVLAASPHKLIVMLFDGALTALNDAAAGIKNSDIPQKGKSLSKAIMIIDSGLRAALDKKAGGDIAESLDALYEYMSNRLLAANVNSDLGMVEEVQRLLIELRDAWNAIADTPAASGIPQPNLASA
ncbi:flagellar export chaperone FliS [Duganella sp. FT109W]|uniref:Flagellar secretion chaperone FliS n=1 Tax=Duganella margarita TaxID=2692170 RepID=A0A7X4H5L9_9BURK|nr:flagellar export chaperone FliS [Duganella margarita]MYM75810.1 flagellar export chaperone FliS [Duganella margarita]MYN43175.1 flagellar export chaperone FliS [Duganella margarita]